MLATKYTKILFSTVLVASAYFVSPLSTAEESQANSSENSNRQNPKAQTCGVSLKLPWLCVNVHEDQPKTDAKHEVWDKDHVPSDGDTDLKEVELEATADKFDGKLTLTILGGADKITSPVGGVVLWKDAEKKDKWTPPYEWTVPKGGAKFSPKIFIEGVENSKLKEVKMKAKIEVPGGDVDGTTYKPCDAETTVQETSVYEVDLDVDTNNDNKFDFAGFNKAEDQIEASEKETGGKKKPGKYVFVNAGFSAADNEAAPGWADGFEVKGTGVAASTSTARDAKFTPIQIELKEPFDEKKAKIKFIYSAADPDSVRRAAGGGTPSDKFTYTLGASGKHLRIWKKDFTTGRDKKHADAGGDYVPDAKDIEWKKISSGRTAKLYLEAVRPSAALGDLKIEVVVTEGDVTCKDAVNVTSVYFKEDKITLNINAAARYAMVANRFTALGGAAVSYSSELKFVPDDVDCSKEPLKDLRCGIMQNLLETTRTSELFNPQAPFTPIIPIAAWPAPGTVDVPVTGTHVIDFAPPRVNDTIPGGPSTQGIDFRPLYPVYGLAAGATLGGALKKPLNCPGGAATTSSDTPSDGTARLVKFSLTPPAPAAPVEVLQVAYLMKRIQFDDKFLTWCAGFNIANKVFYPLDSKKWELIVDTNVVGNQGAAAVAGGAGDLIPVRTPSANAQAVANPGTFTPTPGAVTIQVP